MDVKVKIGLRIKEARKKKQLTASKLAQLTGFSAQRISNWERGTRTPKYEDAEILGNALEVAPTWILCLDIDKPYKSTGFKTIPLIREAVLNDDILPIPTSAEKYIGPHDFSIIMSDESMCPDYNPNDIITFTKDEQKNTNLVLIKIKSSNQILFRKILFDKQNYILAPLNPEWPQLQFNSQKMFEIIGWKKNGIKVFF